MFGFGLLCGTSRLLLRVSACADKGRLMLLGMYLAGGGRRFVSWVCSDRLGMNHCHTEVTICQ